MLCEGAGRKNRSCILLMRAGGAKSRAGDTADDARELTLSSSCADAAPIESAKMAMRTTPESFIAGNS